MREGLKALVTDLRIRSRFNFEEYYSGVADHENRLNWSFSEPAFGHREHLF